MLVDPDVERALRRAPLRVGELGFDPWGMSPRWAELGYSVVKRIVQPYFRPEVHGIEHVPEGRALLVANHSGQLPLDGIVVALACLLHADPPRLVRPMVERWFASIPFVNEVMARGGATLGAPINCRNLLEDEQCVLVFPEGARGSGKPWSKRYQLQPFGRGFLRLALQTGTPIVPIGIVGGEESIVSLADLKPLARLLGFPYFPLSPHYVPLPVKFHLWFGEPLRFEGRHDDEDVVIDAKVRTVMDVVDALVQRGLAARRSIF